MILWSCCIELVLSRGDFGEQNEKEKEEHRRGTGGERGGEEERRKEGRKKIQLSTGLRKNK